MRITASHATSGVRVYVLTPLAIFVITDPIHPMTTLASSPDRYTFQQERYRKILSEETDPEKLEDAQSMIDMYTSWGDQAKSHEAELEWQKDNMEYDLRTSEYMCSCAKASKRYAQNLYAAMCNRQFQKLSVVPLLKDQRWSCSWRSAGGIVANMIEQGDYIDWYCSGIGDGLGNGDPERVNGYVSESDVTDEIRKDLKQLGWIVLDVEDDDR